MSTVLWGARKGDVQYGSGQYWRAHIPIDPAVFRLTVDWAGIFYPGALIVLPRTGETFVCAGIEGYTLGMRDADQA